MAQIAIRKNGGNETVPAAARPEGREWRPWRALADWDPFRTLLPVPGFEGIAKFYPDFDVKETKGEFVFKADLPGIEEKDLQVALTGNRLQITGKRETEREVEGETYYVCERAGGAFTRTFTLPEGVDGTRIRAELKDGLLSITIPKKPEAQPKKIPISTKG